MERPKVTSFPLASLSSRLGDRFKGGQMQEEQRKEAKQTTAASRSRLQQAAAAVGQHPAGAAVVSAVTAYIGLRVGIEVFHRTRRRFLRRLLRDLCPTLEALGQTYWLDFGGLLGVHRDGDLIPHDNDVDLAVLNPDWEALLEGLRQHLSPKYSLKVITSKDTPETHWIRVYCPLGMADLFGAYDKGGQKIRIDFGHGDVADIDRDLVLPPARETFRGLQLNVPRDVEGTLAFRYGPTWRTPRYLDKGADTVESSKPYAKLFKALSYLGIRF